MAKLYKTAAELKEFILAQIGIKVTIRADKSFGWTATPFVSTPHTFEDQIVLDRLLTELRRKYELKSE
jgi:hypothetical protein